MRILIRVICCYERGVEDQLVYYEVCLDANFETS
jgi:hypothetical protein